MVAASLSSARSASTALIAGWSISRFWKAERCAVCHSDWARLARICPAEPITQSSRVSWTIRMIVATPRPSSPTRWASAPWYSISDEALDLSPSLSLSRITRKPALRSPSGSQRGTRKQVRPPSA